MQNTRVKFSTILEKFLPNFVKDSYPLAAEFLKQYYKSLETKGSTLDVLQNIDQYVKIDNIANQDETITLVDNVTVFDTSIRISGGFKLPQSHGLIQIDDEIVLYKSKLFVGNGEFILNSCIRGFSGIINYQPDNGQDYLEFSDSESSSHIASSSVKNLSNLILSEFFVKIKAQFAPGFETEGFYPQLNQNIFVKQLRDFYSSKGTDESFRILFKALYGEKVEVIKPQDYLFIPSNSQYRVSKNLVVESIKGDIFSLEGRTIYQKESLVSSIARATVNRVQLIQRSGKNYYVLSLDFDYDKDINLRGSTFGTFNIGPKTTITEKVLKGEYNISVDSTIGFPKYSADSNLHVILQDGSAYSFPYSSTTNNQFLGIEGGVPVTLESGTEIRYDCFCYGATPDENETEDQVEFRITGVLSDLEIEENFGMRSDSRISFKTMGKSEEGNILANNWIFNLPVQYDVKSIVPSGTSGESYTYTVELYDNNILKSGDLIDVISSTPRTYEITNPITVTSDRTFSFSLDEQLNLNLTYRIQRKVNKFKYFLNSEDPQDRNKYHSDISNVYYGKDSNEIYISSPSLPNYRNDTINPKTFLISLNENSFISEVDNEANLNIKDKIINFGSQNPHPFLTGDEVFYSAGEGTGLNLVVGRTYYVERVSDTEIKLASTRSNISTKTFVDVQLNIVDGDISFGSNHKIYRFGVGRYSQISSAKILRKIEPPKNDSNVYFTPNGRTGIFINGVEVLNYKSDDYIYYNKINSLNLVSRGRNYDAINVPEISITDANGTGCKIYPFISGDFKEIRVIDGGFDYLETPSITISGGNGRGAIVEPSMGKYEYSVNFDGSGNSGLITLTTGTIGFSTYHNFYSGEQVFYEVSEDASAISGLVKNSKYYIGTISDVSIRLYNTYEDAVKKVNQVIFGSYGYGKNTLRSVEEKNRIDSIKIVSGGVNYSNKKVFVNSVGINTYSNAIVCPDKHGYQTNEKIIYNHYGSPIVGISTTSSYYVNVIDDFAFNLSSSKIEDLNNFSKVSITGVGLGTHVFQYEPITVTVSGVDRINASAELQPIVRGQIDSLYLYEKGTNYGSPKILNYKKEPEYEFLNGSDAQLTPIIVGGKIVKVIVNNPGKNYNSTPDIEVEGKGKFAKLIPVIVNKKIVDVLIQNSGIGYDSNSTSLTVKSAGTGAKILFELQSWNINIVERYLLTSGLSGSAQILDDNDSFVVRLSNELHYTHAYAPRKLRESLLTKKLEEGNFIYSNDLVKQSGIEVDSELHSPILGWSYDGNPIYGPYGFENKNGSGRIVKMVSGYSKVTLENRPPLPDGIFVEDYAYFGPETVSGSQVNPETILDEHNGRFCVTPEFPNGVYAYFCTVGDVRNEFNNYKKPAFPYIIGNTYHSKPIEYNFSSTSYDRFTDINIQKWLRNTYPYNLTEKRSRYTFLTNILDKGNLSKISSVSKGNIDNIQLVSGGSGYRVNDRLVFENNGTGGINANGIVEELKGKNVVEININSLSNSTNLDYNFIPNSNKNGLIGITSEPHNILNGQSVLLSGLKNYVQNSSSDVISTNVIVNRNTLVLLNDVDTSANTGYVTYFTVSGNISYPTVKENDVYIINDVEKVKVLRVEPQLSRIWVLRNYESSGGGTSVYSSGTIIFELPSKFEFSSPIETNRDYRISRNYYFYPNESLGIGITYGPQYGKTVTFSNPGTGTTQIFIQTQRIYLPGHNIENGTKLIYSSEEFTPISISTDGLTFSQLTNGSTVYATKIDSNFIGISTFPVGISTTSGFYTNIYGTGLLYFSDPGTGLYHSFETLYSTNNSGKLTTNLATVVLEEEHELNVNDNVRIDVISGFSTSVNVSYNKTNRRIVFNRRDYIASNVSVSNNSITIENHGYYTGQKVIYNSTSSGNLQNDKIYYIIVVDKNTVKVSSTYENAVLRDPSAIDLTTSVAGAFSSVNPGLNYVRNQKIIFDLSNSSLSFTRNSQNYSSFKLNFYRDPDFTDLFETIITTPTNPGIVRTGLVGITSTAKVELNVDDNFPDILYYKFDLDNLKFNPVDTNSIVIDNEVKFANQILLSPSKYNKVHTIVGIASTSFNISLFETPELQKYDSNNSVINYYTNSYSETGEISKIKVVDQGRGYKSLPGISSIAPLDANLTPGLDSVVFSKSKTIGKVKKFEIQNIGSDYYCDLSLRPTAKLPEIIKVEPFSSFESIRIISPGQNYLIPPNLVVLDGFTNLQDPSIVLQYELNDQYVSIVKNSRGLYNQIPTIIPINNSNGISIRDITYNASTKEATVFLNVGFSLNSNPFPFEVGDQVLIENTNVGIGTVNNLGEYSFIQTGTGYNSSDYNYELLEVTSIAENYGGTGYIVCSMNGVIEDGETPGVFNKDLSESAIVTPNKYFPILDIKLTKNTYLVGETVSTPSATGIVEYWDPKNELLTVLTADTFKVEETILGNSTYSTAKIVNVDTFNATYSVDGSAVVNEGWSNESGFLNNSIQRMPDNDYYQYFSYSLKSKKGYSEWESSVSKLNHISGYKKFSDLIIESPRALGEIVGVGATAATVSDVNVVTDFVQFANFNCYDYFDLATENAYYISNLLVSDEVIFGNIEIQDYTESIGNRVLVIDDISSQFNNTPRSTAFSIVDSFELSSAKYKKYFAYIRDKSFVFDRQFNIVSLIYDTGLGYINQYAKVETTYDIGNFDFSIAGTQGNLEFYPTNFSVNDYDISLVSFNISDIAGISTYNIGSVSCVESNRSQILPGIGTTTISLVGIASTYRTAKLLVSANNANNTYFEVNEITVLRDNSDNIHILEYGQLSNDSSGAISGPGIGTFNAYYDNSTSKIIVDLTTNISLASTIYFNTSSISIASNSDNISESLLDNSRLYSSFVAISSSPTPGITTVASQTKDYASAYHIVSIADTIGGRYQTSELAVVSYGTSCYLTEFGIVSTDSSLCSFGCTVAGTDLNLEITPIPDTSLEVRVFSTSLKIYDGAIDDNTINIGSTKIVSENNSYSGTEKDVRKEFELTYDSNPIFERPFNSENPLIVDLQENQFNLINHYFTSGEEISYTASGGSPIGIVTTSIPGIGSTDKLPSKLFVVKINDKAIRVATSSTEALKFDPDVLTLQTLGIGTIHKFIAKNQNNKSLIMIDNVVQTPIVSTAVTTAITSNIELADVRVDVQDGNKFTSGDLLKVDNEIFKVNTVGFGSTNTLLVERQILGSGLSTHTSGSIAAKITGTYNIVDNKIFFPEAPFGKIPVSVSGGSPDEIDWTGVTTSSTFHGRVFLRSAAIGSTEETYSKNYIFDDVSSEFTGIKTEFVLKSNGQNVTGISTSNIIVLIRDIFQIPQKSEIFDPKGNYRLVGTSQTTSLFLFNSATGLQNLDDVNVSNVPVGGVIVSVASKGGLGYQPLISAGATSVVSSAGTISSLSIGSTGSGYRKSPNYQIITKTSENISIGSTNIKVNNVQSLLQKLPYTSSSTISIGSLIKEVAIVGYTTNSILIGSGSTINSSISNSTTVKVTLNNPTTTLINIGISTIGNENNISHLGFTTSNSGYISTNIQITNPGFGYTEYNFKSQTTTSSIVSIGSTSIPLSTIDNIDIGDYITVGTALTSVQIVGIGSTSILISTGSTVSYSIASGTSSIVKEFNPPIVIFDQPLSYSNIPLKYSSSSLGGSGIGTNAYIDIVVGQDSKIVDFDLKKSGYAYKKGDILTVSTNGDNLLGIATDTSTSFSEFQLTVDQVYQDKFSAWSLGDMSILDSLDSLFDGQRKQFPIKVNGDVISIRAKKGSSIDVEATLIVVINDVVQIPKDSYTFSGGSIITFKEAPKLGDKSHLIFYKGTSSIDVVDVNVLETVKVGDGIYLKDDDITLTQKERVISSIVSSDRVKTNLYNGVGINSTASRSITWCKQTDDKIIDGEKIGKSRDSYEPNIVQTTRLIDSIGINSTELFVESTNNLFNYQSENTTTVYKGKIKIVSEDIILGAAATCTVSAAGTIASFTITESGSGYSSAPTVFVQNAIGFGTTSRAIGQANISGGIVTSITVSNPGIGYTVGPMNRMVLLRNGSGYPSGLSTARENNIYYKAKLKSLTGYGKDATANIGIEGVNINYFEIIDRGNGYSVGDQIFIDNFDNKNLKDSDRNTLLVNSIIFEVKSVDPPLVFINPPTPTVEVISNVSYEGDYGDVVGMGTTGSYFYMDLHIPYDSYMRNSSVVGTAITISGIQTNYYVVVSNSNLGEGSISLKQDNSIIGVGTTCFDNIYQVSGTQVFETNVPGIGVTYIKRITTKVQNLATVGFPTGIRSFDSSTITFDSSLITFDESAFETRTYGKYSWGRISTSERKFPTSFTARTYRAVSGLSTSPIVERFNPLRYRNYT